MDLVLKLRELRKLRGLSQADAARKSGLGVKTLSSFETGERIAAMKLTQLQRLLCIYGVSEAEFFSSAIEHLLAPWDHEPESEIESLVRTLRELPAPMQSIITDKLRLAIDLARDFRRASETRSRDQQSHRGAAPLPS